MTLSSTSATLSQLPCLGRVDELAVAAIALLELAAVELTASVVATVRAQKPIGPSPLKERIEALVFGAVEREEFVEADSFLKLHWVACHVNFLFLSLSYMAIFYTKYSLDSRVIRKAFEIHAGVVRGELPVDLGLDAVSGRLPSRDLVAQDPEGGDAAVEALTDHDAELDLGDVEPTAVLGRVDELEAVPQGLGHGRRKGLVEGAGAVGVQVVHHQCDSLGAGVALGDVVEEVRPVSFGSACRHLGHAPPGQGFRRHEHVTASAASVLVVFARGPTRRRREPSRGAQELVDGAAGGEFVEPAEGSEDGLLDAFSFAAVFRDLKILIRADLLDADEHEASPELTPHILRRLSRIFQCIGEYFLEIRARIYHYISEQHRPDRFISS